MRRFIKIVAGAAIIAAATASGASAIQVLPKAGGGTARFPGQPYISDNDQVTRGNPNGTVTVHGSCFGARNVAAGNNLTVDNPSIPATPTATLLGEYPYGGTAQPPGCPRFVVRFSTHVLQARLPRSVGGSLECDSEF